MSESIGIVWNPSKVDEPELRDAFAAAAEQAGRPSEARWFETAEDDPGGEAAGHALAAGCSLVIAAGGDGTVRAVASRLGMSDAGGGDGPRAELGIVPLGTGNLLARNLEIPLGDPRAAFERALTGEGSALDLGVVSLPESSEAREIGFVVMIGFGVDAQMIEETDDELKAKAGWLAYVESLGRAASGTESVVFSLTVDNEPARDERAHTVLVGNCGSLQGGIPLLPDAEPDDGELDLLVLSADDAASWIDTARNVVWDNGLKRLLPGGGTGSTDDSGGSNNAGEDQAESSDSVSRLRARRISVELAEPRVLEVDGDTVGEVSSFEVRVLPGALRVR